jgi:crotonobetainyl-CoA:carnitine CoA-transferase CaiB-like acyl-CoA transferase
MLNQDEWPDMKQIIQKFFSRHKTRELDAMFEGKDCCVQRVLSVKEALDSPFVKEIVVTGSKTRPLQTAIWKQLVKEADLRKDVVIVRPAKL